MPDLKPISYDGPNRKRRQIGPNDTLLIEGSIKLGQFVTVSASGAITLSNYHIDADASGGEVVLDLPTAIGNTSLEFQIKKIDTSDNFVRINPNGLELIDGFDDVCLSRFGSSIKVKSDGTNWKIV